MMNDDYSIELVVARYKENIAWLDGLPWKTTVYSKSSEMENPSWIPRPNIGREAETWLYHIVENYDRLASLTVFLQGNPFDHMDAKCTEALKDHIDRDKMTTKVIGVSKGHLHTEGHDAFNHPVVAFYKILLDDPVPPQIKFIPGAQYMVPRDVIRARPLKFYQRLHEMICNNDKPTAVYNTIFDPNVICAWTIERLWMYIWNPDLPTNPSFA